MQTLGGAAIHSAKPRSREQKQSALLLDNKRLTELRVTFAINRLSSHMILPPIRRNHTPKDRKSGINMITKRRNLEVRGLRTCSLCHRSIPVNTSNNSLPCATSSLSTADVLAGTVIVGQARRAQFGLHPTASLPGLSKWHSSPFIPYCLFFREGLLDSWRWRTYIPSKRREKLTKPHGVISKNIYTMNYLTSRISCNVPHTCFAKSAI